MKKKTASNKCSKKIFFIVFHASFQFRRMSFYALVRYSFILKKYLSLLHLLWHTKYKNEKNFIFIILVFNRTNSLIAWLCTGTCAACKTYHDLVSMKKSYTCFSLFFLAFHPKKNRLKKFFSFFFSQQFCCCCYTLSLFVCSIWQYMVYSSDSTFRFHALYLQFEMANKF